MTKFSPSGMIDPAIPVPAEPECFFSIGIIKKRRTGGSGILMVLSFERLDSDRWYYQTYGYVIQFREKQPSHAYMQWTYCIYCFICDNLLLLQRHSPRKHRLKRNEKIILDFRQVSPKNNKNTRNQNNFESSSLRNKKIHPQKLNIAPEKRWL